MIAGKGGFGKVWIVQSKISKKYYALKELNKIKIINKKSLKSIWNERNFLVELKHPFIINLLSCFQNKNNLYLIMDLLTGGDFRFHICTVK